uniref:Uncharacterized protein n=1 Tax=Setaria viridis TaxID=4556 RepID=A0A4U6SV98_SETVI|nr:hypothetical protein SEVIR_9G146766v2 [Setaria viridis]
MASILHLLPLVLLAAAAADAATFTVTNNCQYTVWAAAGSWTTGRPGPSTCRRAPPAVACGRARGAPSTAAGTGGATPATAAACCSAPGTGSRPTRWPSTG